MKKLISIKNLMAFFVAVFGILTISTGAQAQAVQPVERINPGHVFDPSSICGNGVIENDEECDHGSANGSDGDICGQDCLYNIPEDKRECVEDFFNDCIGYDPGDFRGGLVEAADLRELREVSQVQDVRVAEQAPSGSDPDDRDDKKDEEVCLEKALKECTEEPQPEEPVEPAPEPEDKGQTTDTLVQLEGSGCSLSMAAQASNGFGILLGLGMLIGLRRRK